MEITFLGTSSGLPTKQRNVSGIALRRLQGSAWYLIDCGEGTQHRLLHTGLSLSDLDTVFITHMHGDHCYGLPGVLATAATRGRTAPITIVGPAAIEHYIKAVCDTSYLSLPYPLNFQAVEAGDVPVQTDDFEVSFLPLSHRVPSYGYVFTEKIHKQNLDTAKLSALGIAPGPLWGQLQRGEDVLLQDGETLFARDFLLHPPKPRRLIISGDNDRPELYSQAAEGVDLMVHEATYTDAVARKVEPGPQHSSALQVARFASQHAVPNLILTHFSQRYHNGGKDVPSINEVHDEAVAHYQGTLFLANDLDVFRLDRAGTLSRVAASLQQAGL